MTTHNFTLILEDCEIIALEKLVQNVYQGFSNNGLASNNLLNDCMSKAISEEILKKITVSRRTISLRSSSSFGDLDIFPAARPKL